METRVNHPLLNRAGNARLRTTQPTRKDKRGGVKRETGASFSHGYAKLVLCLTRATVHARHKSTRGTDEFMRHKFWTVFAAKERDAMTT